MLPEPNEISKKDSLPTNSPKTSQIPQYGFNHSISQPSRQLHSEHVAVTVRDGSSPWSPTLHAPASETSSEASEASSRGLSPTNRHTGASTDRITKHEKAMLRRSKKQHKGPAFTITQTVPTGVSAAICIVDFPNGKLVIQFQNVEINSRFRGFDACTFAPATDFALECLVSVQTLP